MKWERIISSIHLRFKLINTYASKIPFPEKNQPGSSKRTAWLLVHNHKYICSKRESSKNVGMH